jgi:hypothetical protein
MDQVIFILFWHLGAGSVYYYVVFNGFHMHEQKITSYTTNRKVRLGIEREYTKGNMGIFCSSSNEQTSTKHEVNV